MIFFLNLSPSSFVEIDNEIHLHTLDSIPPESEHNRSIRMKATQFRGDPRKTGQEWGDEKGKWIRPWNFVMGQVTTVSTRGTPGNHVECVLSCSIEG